MGEQRRQSTKLLDGEARASSPGQWARPSVVPWVMDCLVSFRGSSCLGALALTLACTNPNPAFDPDRMDATGTSDSSPGDGDPKTAPGDGDPSTAPGDGDPNADTSTEEGPLLDMGGPYCSINLNPSLEPTVLNPAFLDGQVCPDEFLGFVKVKSVGGVFWNVSLCPTSCGSCLEEEDHPVGAPGLSLPMLLAPDINLNDPYTGCYLVEAEVFVRQDADRCVYETMAIFGYGGLQTPPLFAASQRDRGLSSSAHSSLGVNWEPTLVDGEVCPCEEIDPELVGCCGGGDVEASYVQFGDGNAAAPPTTGSATIGAYPYEVYVMQAQTGASCDVSNELSWAMTLEG